MLPAQGVVRCVMGLAITALRHGLRYGTGVLWRGGARCLALLHFRSAAREGV